MSETTTERTTTFSGIGAISLFVDDVSAAKQWYQATFDRPVIFEDDDSAVIEFGNTLINLLARPAATSLIAPAAVAESGAGAQFQFTIWVADADEACATLRSRGVAFINGPMDRAWGQRTACFADPDGHVWEVAQTLGP